MVYDKVGKSLVLNRLQDKTPGIFNVKIIPTVHLAANRIDGELLDLQSLIHHVMADGTARVIYNFP